MKNNKKVAKRTRKQFQEFQKAFKSWCDKFREKINKTNVTEKGIEIYRTSEPIQMEGFVRTKYTYLSQYIAPDYIKYMSYMLRKYK